MDEGDIGAYENLVENARSIAETFTANKQALDDYARELREKQLRLERDLESGRQATQARLAELRATKGAKKRKGADDESM
eukprot:10424929-Lingulodinium_polyedra.AAC.1